uniref:Dormancy-associated protein homolog 3-like n=1 Tax=Nelumbo nucifera TaxID=4432 RepID=A0A822YQG8_NELNU|nr:TPA_asm: hypothetical protein HUJ06_012126 [Nelumbo nucifera]
MGLLDKLWDDTLAGPLPDNGLGKLRKNSTFSFRPNLGKEADGGNGRSYGDESTDEAMRVTRSITIIKPPGNLTIGNGSPPVSPAGSTPPVSPFSGKSVRLFPSFVAQMAKIPLMVIAKAGYREWRI